MPPAAGAQCFVKAATTGHLLSSASVNVSSSVLCLARQSFFIFLFVPLVGNGILGGPKDHPSCFWATKAWTADLPVNFTLVSLGRDFKWFPYFFPLCIESILQPRISLEKNLFRSQEGTLETLSFNTVCGGWDFRRGRCLLRTVVQLPGPLTRFPVASLQAHTPGLRKLALPNPLAFL